MKLESHSIHQAHDGRWLQSEFSCDPSNLSPKRQKIGSVKKENLDKIGSVYFITHQKYHRKGNALKCRSQKGMLDHKNTKLERDQLIYRILGFIAT